MSEPTPTPPVVVVTGANGLVGSRTCAALVERGATVRAVVRRPGTAPALAGRRGAGRRLPRPGARGCRGRRARARSSRPSTRWAADRETQHRIAVEGTPVLARAARDAGVERLVHVSTGGRLRPLTRRRRRGRGVAAGHRRRRRLRRDQARHRRRPGRRSTGSPASCSGRRRSSAPGESSVWNSVRPARSATTRRPATPSPSRASRGSTSTTSPPSPRTWPPGGSRPRPTPESGPVAGACTVVNVAAGPATAPRLLRDGDRGPRRRAGLGRRTGVDRPDPRRPRPRLGLVAGGGPRPGAGRDRRRAAPLTDRDPQSSSSRHTSTRTRASRMTAPDIFDSPRVRSVNVIGTSTTRRPAALGPPGALDLEAVAVRRRGGDVDPPQRRGPERLEARRGVVDAEREDQPRRSGCPPRRAAGGGPASPRDRAAGDVAGPDATSACVEGRDQRGHPLRRVGEVGVHLDDRLVVPGQRPSRTRPGTRRRGPSFAVTSSRWTDGAVTRVAGATRPRCRRDCCRRRPARRRPGPRARARRAGCRWCRASL